MTSHDETIGPFAVGVARPLPPDLRAKAAQAALAAALATIPPDYSPSVAPAPAAARKAPQAPPPVPTVAEVARRVAQTPKGRETVAKVWGYVRSNRARAPWTFREIAEGSGVSVTGVVRWVDLLTRAGYLERGDGWSRTIRIAEGRAQ